MRLRIHGFTGALALAGMAIMTLVVASPANAAVVSHRVVSVESGPSDVVVQPDGKKAWTTHTLSGNILGFTTEAIPFLRGVWHLGGVNHTEMAIAPDSIHALLVSHLSSTVYAIDLTNGVYEDVPALSVPDPVTVAYSHDGRYAAVGYSGIPQVTVVNTSDWSVVHTWTLPVDVATVLFSKDDAEVFAVSQGDSHVTRFSLADPSVTSWFGTGSDPWGAVLSPDGTKMYLALETGQGVDVHDTATGDLITHIALGMFTHQVAVSPDGTQLWVTNSLDDMVTIIDTSTFTISDQITLTGHPESLDFTPDGCQVWVTQSQADTDTVYTLSPCLGTPASLPDTGASQTLIITLASVGGGLVILGVLAMIVVRRRRHTHEEQK